MAMRPFLINASQLELVLVQFKKAELFQAYLLNLFQVFFADPTPPGGPHTILWTCDQGHFDDFNSQTPKWYPPDNTGEYDINIEIIDEFGLSDSGSVHQWVTSLPTINNPSAPGNAIISQALGNVFGGTVNPADFVYPNDESNGTVVVVSYWSNWSSDSLSGIPSQVDLWNANKNSEYVHLMLNIGDSADGVADFVNMNMYQGPYWLLDTSSAYFTSTQGWAGNSSTLPQTLLFDRDGRCRLAHVGQLTLIVDFQLAVDELM
jgi:hypothetical protein